MRDLLGCPRPKAELLLFTSRIVFSLLAKNFVLICLAAVFLQFDYLASLCEWTGTPMFEPWREDLFKDFSFRRHNYPANYRDEWPEDLELKRKVIWEDLQKEAAKII